MFDICKSINYKWEFSIAMSNYQRVQPSPWWSWVTPSLPGQQFNHDFGKPILRWYTSLGFANKCVICLMMFNVVGLKQSLWSFKYQGELSIKRQFVNQPPLASSRLSRPSFHLARKFYIFHTTVENRHLDPRSAPQVRRWSGPPKALNQTTRFWSIPPSNLHPTWRFHGF